MNAKTRTLALTLFAFTTVPSFACDHEAGPELADDLVLADHGLRSADDQDLLIDEHLTLTFVESADNGLSVAVDLDSLAAYLGTRGIELHATVHRPDGTAEALVVAADDTNVDIEMSWVGTGHYEVELTSVVVDGVRIVDEPFASRGMTIMEARPDALTSTPRSTAAKSCSSGVNITGTAGADDLDGTANEDYIDGKLGGDTIEGHGCRDILKGGGGKDTIYGGSGDDELYGGIQKDTLYGDDGNDYLNGGSGDDVCYGGPGADSFVNCEQVFQ